MAPSPPLIPDRYSTPIGLFSHRMAPGSYGFVKVYHLYELVTKTEPGLKLTVLVLFGPFSAFDEIVQEVKIDMAITS